MVVNVLRFCLNIIITGVFMFERKNNLFGTDYYEFQYCKKNLPIKSLLSASNIENWKDDSLYLKDGDMENILLFEEKYLNFFLETNTPNGSNKYYPFGINYYTQNQTQYILNQLLNSDLPHKKILCDWLKECIEKYNGFYILGI